VECPVLRHQLPDPRHSERNRRVRFTDEARVGLYGGGPRSSDTQAIDLSPALFDETLHFSRSLGDFKPSMLQDLEAGKPLEFEAFNGIVVNLLQRTGKQAPTNQVFYGALKYLDERLRVTQSLRES
jgi:ketopantoate reductase